MSSASETRPGWASAIPSHSASPLETIAVVGPREEIAGKLRARLEGIADGVSLTHNRAPDPGPSGWSMVWSDEFDDPAGTPPSPAHWTHEIGDGTVNGILFASGGVVEINGTVNGDLVSFAAHTTVNGQVNGNGTLRFQGEGGVDLPIPAARKAALEPWRGKAVAMGIRPEDIGSQRAEQQADAPKIRAKITSPPLLWT